MYALSVLLSRAIKRGHLTVMDHHGRAHEFGDASGPPDATIALHDPGTAWRIARNPALYIGEAYVDGSLTVEKGTLLGFISLLLENTQNDRKGSVVFHWARDLLSLLMAMNNIARSKRNVHKHYDLRDELFALFLDRDWQYSCGYFHSAHDTLDDAQFAKKQHIAAKLNIQPGQRILDVGSGWGGLALYLAHHYPVTVTGLTLSREQYVKSNERASAEGLAGRVTFKLADYRELRGHYDRIVSVGMFEHVGRARFGAYFHKVRELLAPGGVALIHTIGAMNRVVPKSTWITRHIFPGGYIPSLAQLVPIFEAKGLLLTDMENLRLHYARTLAAWHERFQARRSSAASLYDERFCRMWEFYLQSCEAAFRWSGLTVYQLQLAKEIDALPITRDYMSREERRLRREDAEAAQQAI